MPRSTSATAAAPTIVYNYDVSAAAVLTLGTHLTINQTGSTAYLYGYDDRTGSGIVNEGTINAGYNGGSFTINDISFTNQGTINVSNGDTLDVASPETGTGSYTINAGSTLEFGSCVGAGAAVTFGASIGTLLLLSPSTFSAGAVISGISGALGLSDVLDLRGFASGSDTITASTANGYNSTTGDTTLTVTDTTTGHSLTVQVTLAGNYYASSSWSVTSDGHGGFDIYDPPAAAAATIAAGASLDISAPSNETVTFNGGTGSLVLNDPEGFSGQIIGFTGTAPDAAHSDTIDLVSINYNSGQFAETYNSATGMLRVSDGTNTASITFDDSNATFDFASDGNGGTLITDPPPNEPANVEGAISFTGGSPADTYSASVTPEGPNYAGTFSLDPVTESNRTVSVAFEFMPSNDQLNLAPGQTLTQSYNVSVIDAQNPGANSNQTVSVSLGGPGNDNFVFHPGYWRRHCCELQSKTRYHRAGPIR